MIILLSSVTLEGRDPMQRRPDRLARLPEQYFSTLLRSVADVARAEGEPLIDLSRGNPEIGPPPHVVDALCAASRRRTAPAYPDYLSGLALAGARVEPARLDAADSSTPHFAPLPRDAAALYLNYPSN